jgi:hypothetical protein
VDLCAIRIGVLASDFAEYSASAGLAVSDVLISLCHDHGDTLRCRHVAIMSVTARQCHYKNICHELKARSSASFFMDQHADVNDIFGAKAQLN